MHLQILIIYSKINCNYCKFKDMKLRVQFDLIMRDLNEIHQIKDVAN